LDICIIIEVTMKEPDDVKAYREGVKLFREGRTLEALQRFKFAAETGEDRPMEHFALAAAHMQVGDLAGARGEYQRFLDMKPSMPDREHAARKALAHIDEKLAAGDQARAAAAAEAAAEEQRQAAARAVEAEKQRREELARVRQAYDEAVAFFRGGGYDSALSRLEALLKDWGRTAEVLNLVGLCRKGLKDLEGAEAAFREAVETSPENVDVLLNLGQLVFERGALQARDFIRQALARDRQNSRSWFNLGVLSLALGEHDAARDAWQRAANLAPEDELARANLEMIKRRQT